MAHEPGEPASSRSIVEELEAREAAKAKRRAEATASDEPVAMTVEVEEELRILNEKLDTILLILQEVRGGS